MLQVLLCSMHGMCVLQVLLGLGSSPVAVCLASCILSVALQSHMLCLRMFVGGFVHKPMAALVPVDAADVGINAVLGNH